MALPEKPITRKETYLAKAAGQSVDLPEYPITREEAYLDEIARNGGGGGGYVLPTATASRLGGVKIGSGINVEEDGTISASGGGGLTLGETSSTAYRGDRGKTAYDHSQTTGNPHGTTASDVGLGNVPNVATNDQEPTFTEASTRNNIASGEKLSVIFGKIQKFFNDLKTVAFSGSFSDLSNKPENANTFQGTIAEWNQLTTAEKKAYDHASIPDSLDGNVTFPASKVMMQNGDSVEEALDKSAGLLDYAHAESITTLPYTAQKNGVAFITVGKVASPEAAAREFSVNGVYVATSTCVKAAGSTASYYNTCQIPLSVGDQLTSPYSVYGTYIFVPYK